MLGTPIASQLRATASRFAGANQGNIAVIFAIALVPIISFVGAAIDYTRANSARSSMQAALDSTALMLSKDLTDGKITASEINAKATTYFTALYTNNDAKSVSINATYNASGAMGSTIVLTGSGAVTTDFMKVAGFPNINFNTGSTSAWGNVRMRVAMALDVTGSMRDDGKMPAMQTAAKSLIDQLSALAKSPGDIYISIVPFAKDVNMGASNYTQSWIDWTDWDAENGTRTCTNWNQWGNCTSSYWTPANHNTWTGCLTDRDQNYDTLNTTPTTSNTSTLFPAEEYTSGNEKYCKSGNDPYLQPIMPLSYNWTSLKTLIDDMEPTGNDQPGHRSGLGVDDAGHGGTVQCAGQGPELYLQGRDHPVDRRFQHAEPLVQQCVPDRCAPEDPVRQRQGRRHHHLRRSGGHRRRRGPIGADLLRQRSGQVLPCDIAAQTVAAFSSIGTSLSKLRVAR